MYGFLDLKVGLIEATTIFFIFVIYESFWTAELTEPFFRYKRIESEHVFLRSIFLEELRIPQKIKFNIFSLTFQFQPNHKKIHYINNILEKNISYRWIFHVSRIFSYHVQTDWNMVF